MALGKLAEWKFRKKNEFFKNEMIALNDIAFYYPGKEFSLEIPQLTIVEGTTTAIIGPSGTGKTTLLNLMAGYFTPQEGKILIDATTISSLYEKERSAFRINTIGLVFQEFELMEYLNVLDNILLPYRLSSSLKLDKKVVERAKELAKKVHIDDKLNRNVNKLSQGERQRVAICRALLPEPPVLLCDEPTGNLDPENKLIVLKFLMKEVKERGTTLVVVTHDHQLLPYFENVIDFSDFNLKFGVKKPTTEAT